MATFNESVASTPKDVLYNSHYVAIPRTFTAAEATDGVVAAGTILEDGVAMYDVVVADNPNGALIVHGFVDVNKLPEEPTADQVAALPLIKFVGYVPEDDGET